MGRLALHSYNYLLSLLYFVSHLIQLPCLQVQQPDITQCSEIPYGALIHSTNDQQHLMVLIETQMCS